MSTDEPRGGMFVTGDVVTRSHGAACHLIALGYEVLEVRPQDNSVRFPASAREAIENFYRGRDELNRIVRRLTGEQRPA